jgi:ATP-binding cassette subfamily B protein
MISKEFGEEGTLLSGGQMQKVALARALYAGAPILIFDEPSSALDPIAEYEFNQTLLERTAGHTLIIVAHRLSTVRMMDRIILIDGERIAEEGSHDELMAKRGLYAQMFDAQRRQYEADGVMD